MNTPTISRPEKITVSEMDGGVDAHSHGMPMAPPGDSAARNHQHSQLTHMTFFWGKDAEILFEGWPGGGRLGMYILALAVIFLISFASEWLSRRKILRETASKAVAVGMMQTTLYAVRVGLAYVVMLAVMSFNGGVFIAAVAGHGLGFFLFRSDAFNRESEKTPDQTSMNC